MVKIVCFLLVLIAVIPDALATNYFSFMYKTDEIESLSSILKKFVFDSSVINSKTPLVSKTMNSNPQINSWSKIPSGVVIEMFISEEYMDKNKYNNYLAHLSKMENFDEIKKRESLYVTGLKGSVFYLSSTGIFTQKTSNIAEINFKQNSPGSFGASFTFFPKDTLFSVSGSAYMSILLTASNSLTTNKISIPPEIGANLYGEYRWEKRSITFYSGIDFENFSTFNMQGIEYDNQLYVDRVGVTYFTVGMMNSFSMFNRQFFTKISAARSIISTYTNNAPQATIDALGRGDGGHYTGYRFLFYLNYKFNDQLYFHSIFKYHTMTGPSDLSTIRIGVGLGYILF